MKIDQSNVHKLSRALFLAGLLGTGGAVLVRPLAKDEARKSPTPIVTTMVPPISFRHRPGLIEVNIHHSPMP